MGAESHPPLRSLAAWPPPTHLFLAHFATADILVPRVLEPIFTGLRQPHVRSTGLQEAAPNSPHESPGQHPGAGPEGGGQRLGLSALSDGLLRS